MDYAKFDGIVTPAVTLIAFGVLVAFVILSFILDHHWRVYTTTRMRLYSMRTIYLVISTLFVLLMVGSMPFLFS